jgi:signal transduction histidine kinase
MPDRALGGAAGPSLAVAQVIAVADATRRRIERDLHDGLQQQLVVLALRVRAVEAMVPAELVELRAELSGVVDEHTNLLDQLHEIANGIHPAVLSEDGLEPALKTLARRSTIPVELTVRADARLPEEVELAAYYIVAEALTNTAKYSHASLVHVLVETRECALRVAVCDDGVGGADPARGTGLVGLTQRAQAIGGTVALHSPPAAGTLLNAALPLGEKSQHAASLPPPPGRGGAQQRLGTGLFCGSVPARPRVRSTPLRQAATPRARSSSPN